MRRGRRDPEQVEVGEALDCWRVVAFEADRRLRLALEMKIPGRGWLEFQVCPNSGGSIIRQTAFYRPEGFAGRAYWALSAPLHNLIFNCMLRALAERAHEAAAEG